jgi:fatty acid desaturase
LDTHISAPSITESRLGPLRQTYARTDSFPRVAHEFSQISRTVREAGLLRRAPWFYAMVGAILAVLFAGAVTGFILLGDSWFQLLIAGALGIIITQIAFLTHESAHRQILSTGPSNDRLARVLAASIGLSYSWWDSKHTRHHSNPNTVGKDPDIDVDTIVFLEEDAEKVKGPLLFITRHQGWLFFPLLTLEGLNLHYLSLRHLFSREPVKARWAELSMILTRNILFFGAIFYFLPLGMAFAFIGVQLAVFGVYMGGTFAPNHKGMPIIDRDARIDFFSKQVRTSRNVSGGWWATWLMGGLNYQVEHHLFPNMPRTGLARTREIVREACVRLDVPYTEATLWQSYGIVIAYLNRVGLSARDPFACPITAEFRRG